VLHLQLIILSAGGDVPVDSKSLLVTDFVNLNIKLAQSFRGAHMDRMCVCVFIGVSARMCMSICVYIVFLKKKVTGTLHSALRHMVYMTCENRHTLLGPTTGTLC
jgi:hypothetical protein